LTLSRDLRRRVRERIESGAEGERRGLRLLALAWHLKADGVVTTITSVVEPRFDLLHLHKFLVISPDDLPDFVEVCARGHDVPCTAYPTSVSALSSGSGYQFAHWKGRLLFIWFNSLDSALRADERLHELLRSALLNRYPFILRARDMIRFYRLQADRQVRYDQGPTFFREPLNYHLTAFYTHIWGMLDTLAQIANRRLGLGLDPFRCHINREDFLDALGAKRPGLQKFIREHGRHWVTIIGDVRHPVAHSALRLQQDLMEPTEESKKSDAEISAILREEDSEFDTIVPPELLREWEPTRIYLWRLSKMKLISDDAIFVESSAGGYFRSPVASVDFDVERINAFIDAFLIGCFGTPSAPAVVRSSLPPTEPP